MEDDDDNEFEIADKTMTGVQVVVTKKTGTIEESDAICLTNEINDSPVELSCEAIVTVNEEEDNVDLKVDSDGENNYVKFSSIKENFKVYNHEDKNKEQTKNGGGETTNKINNGLMMKINYIFFFSSFLLFLNNHLMINI